LYFAGQQGLVERELFSGWNGFGILNLTGIPSRDALSPVSSSWEYIYGFDPLLQMYEISIVKDGMGTHNDSRLLFPGKGYWVHMGENATFRVFIPDM
jgi:hypothetical protein